MRKSAIIATCLLNSGYNASLEQAEHNIRRVFEIELSQLSFSQWNTILPEANADQIIRTVGKATTINVERFIEDLT